MRYFFRHVTKNAYANQNHELVTDWRDAVSFTSEAEADIFFSNMDTFWDMCGTTEEQWNATGGRNK